MSNFTLATFNIHEPSSPKSSQNQPIPPHSTTKNPQQNLKNPHLNLTHLTITPNFSIIPALPPAHRRLIKNLVPRLRLHDLAAALPLVCREIPRAFPAVMPHPRRQAADIDCQVFRPHDGACDDHQRGHHKRGH
jgi:hypothetical protein